MAGILKMTISLDHLQIVSSENDPHGNKIDDQIPLEGIVPCESIPSIHWSAGKPGNIITNFPP
jgi:hypothetical protein